MVTLLQEIIELQEGTKQALIRNRPLAQKLVISIGTIKSSKKGLTDSNIKDHERVAIQYHIRTFNLDAIKKGHNNRADHVVINGVHCIIILDNKKAVSASIVLKSSTPTAAIQFLKV